MEAALAIGALPVSSAEGSIAATMGQLRLVDPVVHAKGAEFSPTGGIDLTQSAINARLILSGPRVADPSAGSHPDISVSLIGPIDAPKRTLDVAAEQSAIDASERELAAIDAAAGS